MDTDKKIITQVAAKIASELTNRDGDTSAKLGEFAVLFESIKGIMFDAVDAGQATASIHQLPTIEQTVQKVFNIPTTENISNATLQIVGKQHGDLPDWLIKACKRDGVTKVYDNRDGLSVNPKRPWFKAVDEDKAYWAPKTRQG